MLAPLAAAAALAFGVSPVGLSDGQTVSGVTRIEASVPAEAQRVEVSIDGRLRAVVTNPPFAYDWDTTKEQNGPHTVELWAVARDGTTASARFTLVVANTFLASLPGIEAGQQLTGVVQLNPQVSGQEAQWVEVLVDDELRWTLPKAPYSVAWNTALETPGTHEVTVWAVAASGLVSQIRVSVVVGAGQTAERKLLLAQTLKHRAATWNLQSLMRVPRTPSGPLQGTLAELVTWRSRAAAARLRAAHPPHLDEWLCIHSHEAGWNNNDTGRHGHYGGLQMDHDFMRGYGPELYEVKGTADNWTPLEQMWVAERAWQVRGFNPWPTTARMCGLL
jgi:hypothetical protein